MKGNDVTKRALPYLFAVLPLLLGSGCKFFGLQQSDTIDVRSLTRADYRVTPEIAVKLSELLREDVAAVEVETKVNGDTLTVTTTKAAQKAIGEFILLLGSQNEAVSRQLESRHDDVLPSDQTEPEPFDNWEDEKVVPASP